MSVSPTILLLAVLSGSLILQGCGNSAPNSERSATSEALVHTASTVDRSCEMRIRLNNRKYRLAKPDERRSAGRRLGLAVTNSCEGSDVQRVVVRALANVRPSKAVVGVGWGVFTVIKRPALPDEDRHPG